MADPWKLEPNPIRSYEGKSTEDAQKNRISAIRALFFAWSICNGSGEKGEKKKNRISSLALNKKQKKNYPTWPTRWSRFFLACAKGVGRNERERKMLSARAIEDMREESNRHHFFCPLQIFTWQVKRGGKGGEWNNNGLDLSRKKVNDAVLKHRCPKPTERRRKEKGKE